MTTTKNPYGQVNDSGYCQCSKRSGGCGRVFAGLTGFDGHMERVGQGNEWTLRCLSDEELAAGGFYRDPRGWWHVEG